MGDFAREFLPVFIYLFALSLLKKRYYANFNGSHRKPNSTALIYLISY